MSQVGRLSVWADILDFPMVGRRAKPRDQGLTMVIDKGMGLTETRELLDLAANYIDFIKLGFGTSALYSTRLLQEKIGLVKSYGVDIFPGGTFLEVAVLQGKLEAYLETSKKLGYTFIEVSDGTITMTRDVRDNCIARAKAWGFGVITEVGKKDPRDRVSTMDLHRQVQMDLEAGAYKVIVEGRESGKGVVIYDADGRIMADELADLVANIADVSRILWEAPLKNQQQELIMCFGANVNLGNIHAGDVLALEALRVGLRGDTLRAALLAQAGV